MEFRKRHAMIDRRIGLEENRQIRIGIDTHASVINVSAAQLIPAADVVIDRGNGVIRVVEIRRRKRQQTERNINAVHRRRRIVGIDGGFAGVIAFAG